ncbi:MAG: hypothetical protein AB8F65_06345 [Woeseiaceae bacterium]
MMRTVPLLGLATALILAACQQTKPIEEPAPTSGEPAVSLGNGELNWIIVDDIRRDGETFTVSEVLIDKPGWLVIHRFKDGKPFGDDYVAASYLNAGTNLDVSLSLPEAPEPGTPFLIMLHSDVNENQAFDFVFVDERNVLDKAVFEGSTMISQIFKTP